MWIMRHGEDAVGESARPLLPQGVKVARAAGVALKSLKTPIQACLCSPVPRARDTADLVCEALDLQPIVEPALAGPPADFKGLVRGRGNCLVVSHSAALEREVYRLTGAQMHFAKGSLAQIHEGELWTLLLPSTILAMTGQTFDPATINTRDNEEDSELVMRDWTLV